MVSSPERDAAAPRWVAVVAALVATWVLLSWPLGLLLRPDRLDHPGELEYLVADVVVLLPLALVTLAVRRRARGAALVLAGALLGALAYDVAHFAVFTARGLAGLPRWGVAAGAAMLLGLLATAVSAAARSR